MVVIFASGDRCEPTEAVPSTTFKGGFDGRCCMEDGTTVWVLESVLARERKGVRVMSVASVPLEMVDRREPKEWFECDEEADDTSSEGSRLCLRGEGAWSVFRLS